MHSNKLVLIFRKIKKPPLLILLFGLAIVITVPLAFYIFVGKGMPFSNSGSDWAAFGDYFGGVSGALLSFISIILVVYTIWKQQEQIKNTQKESQRSDVIKNIFLAYSEIEKYLQLKIAAKTDFVEVVFGHIVWGIVGKDYSQKHEFLKALQRLFQLTYMYCICIGEYKNNFNKIDFMYKVHSQKARELLKYIENNTEQKNEEFDSQMRNCLSQL